MFLEQCSDVVFKMSQSFCEICDLKKKKKKITTKAFFKILAFFSPWNSWTLRDICFRNLLLYSSRSGRLQWSCWESPALLAGGTFWSQLAKSGHPDCCGSHDWPVDLDTLILLCPVHPLAFQWLSFLSHIPYIFWSQKLPEGILVRISCLPETLIVSHCQWPVDVLLR